MRRILIGLCVLCWVASAGAAQAQDDPKAVIEKAVKAMGGLEKLSKYSAGRVKSKGTMELMGMTVPFEGEIINQGSDQIKMEFQMDFMGNKIAFAQGVSKGKGWRSVMGNTEELQGDELADVQSGAYGHHVGSLVPILLDKEKTFTLSLVGESKVNGKPATGVKVTSKDRKDINLYFDRESGLLVKLEHRAREPGGAEVNQENFFSDYKDVNGIKHHMKYLIHNDGKKFIEGEVTEAKLVEKLEESVFAKP